MEFIWMIIIGMTVGWMAKQFIKGEDFGVTVDIISGMAGALIAGLLLERTGLLVSNGIAGNLLAAISGAIALLYGIRAFKKT